MWGEVLYSIVTLRNKPSARIGRTPLQYSSSTVEPDPTLKCSRPPITTFRLYFSVDQRKGIRIRANSAECKSRRKDRLPPPASTTPPDAPHVRYAPPSPIPRGFPAPSHPAARADSHKAPMVPSACHHECDFSSESTVADPRVLKETLEAPILAVEGVSDHCPKRYSPSYGPIYQPAPNRPVEPRTQHPTELHHACSRPPLWVLNEQPADRHFSCAGVGWSPRRRPPGQRRAAWRRGCTSSSLSWRRPGTPWRRPRCRPVEP